MIWRKIKLQPEKKFKCAVNRYENVWRFIYPIFEQPHLFIIELFMLYIFGNERYESGNEFRVK